MGQAVGCIEVAAGSKTFTGPLVSGGGGLGTSPRRCRTPCTSLPIQSHIKVTFRSLVNRLSSFFLRTRQFGAEQRDGGFCHQCGPNGDYVTSDEPLNSFPPWNGKMTPSLLYENLQGWEWCLQSPCHVIDASEMVVAMVVDVIMTTRTNTTVLRHYTC